MELNKQDIQEKMAGFREKFKLSSIVAPPEIEKILTASREYFKASSKEDLCYDAIKLSQFSLFIRNEANRLRANIAWCDANINSILGRELSNTQGYGFIEKSLIIKRNDITARELDGIKTTCDVQLKSIEDTDKKIEFMASCIKNLVFDRRNQ